MDIRFLLAIGSFTWAAVAEAGDRSIRIVEEGRPRAVVVVADEADEQTRSAAELLVQYVQRSSGAVLPMEDESAFGTAASSIGVHVGPGDFVNRLDLGIDELDDDGFVIACPDQQHVVIAGPTPHGTEFGVCEFLERYLGVRWLMPGPDGDDVPVRPTIDVSTKTVRQEPAFFSRLFSGLQGSQQLVWARRNRMHGRVEFHHNLHRLFPPETYVKSHPHFFPIRNEKRYFPADNNTHGWQPCFSAEGIVEEAIENICRYFDGNPQATSYSLGVIDSSGHCECPECQAEDSGKPNFLGRRDVSDRYYQWCNRVAEGVLKKHPDKFFGCLAYSEVAQPPSRVKVHERIVPYMTYDRMKWIDPELRAEGQRVTEWWQSTSPVLGWYDYIYGWTYCVPRVWFHQMADYYRYGHQHGVRAMYAEAYPNWGEGPKLYVSLKLQWDVNQDVNRLLDEWYVRTVGKEAASCLAEYYALWEDFWTRRILASDWFSKSGQYLRFNNPSYLADVTDQDVDKSRALMDQVVQKAQTAEQKARAELLAKAFEYYEASAVAYGAEKKAGEVLLQSEDDALQAVDDGARTLAMAKKRQQLVLEEYPKYPYLLRQIDLDRYTELRGDGWGAGLLWRAFDWIDRSDAVRDRVAELADSPTPVVSIQAKTMLLLTDQTSQPISGAPSFENPQGGWPAAWSPWIKWGIGTKKTSPDAAHSGQSGLLCSGIKRGGPHQTIEVTPGRYAAVAYVRVPQAVAEKATISLQITPLDEQGNNLRSLSSTIRAQACDWTRIAVAGELPAAIDGKRVNRARLIVLIDGFEPDEEVHVDDVAMFKLE